MLGSTTLAQSLMAHGLVDECVLMIHPLVLGGGHRLFSDGGPHQLFRFVESVTTGTGVIIASYGTVPARPGT
jgi:dihydrofolate reductase